MNEKPIKFRYLSCLVYHPYCRGIYTRRHLFQSRYFSGRYLDSLTHRTLHACMIQNTPYPPLRIPSMESKSKTKTPKQTRRKWEKGKKKSPRKTRTHVYTERLKQKNPQVPCRARIHSQIAKKPPNLTRPVSEQNTLSTLRTVKNPTTYLCCKKKYVIPTITIRRHSFGQRTKTGMTSGRIPSYSQQGHERNGMTNLGLFCAGVDWF